MKEQSTSNSLAAIAKWLAARRPAIVEAWERAVSADESLSAGDALPRSQLRDHIPAAMEAFARGLAGGSALAERVEEAADAHGSHRWQQGYDLRGVVRELGHLNAIVVEMLDAAAVDLPEASAALPAARLAWAQAQGAAVEQSAARFQELQRIEAEGHVKDLEAALSSVEELDRLRASEWERVAHDLRGNVGVVAAATRGLSLKGGDALSRDRFVDMVERNVESLRHLLDDVTALARLQAGAEARQLTEFDASALLRGLCGGLAALAEQNGLSLAAAGSAEQLIVQGDPVKVRRLAQNLVINALKYTPEGGVEVSWGPAGEGDAKRWRLAVADTGPGLEAGPGAPLASALEEATAIAREDEPTPGGERPIRSDGTAKAVAHQVPGEGIGLSIVKRLAELLDATIEVDSSSDGTTFAVLLPRVYEG